MGTSYFVADYELYRRFLDRFLCWTSARADVDRCFDELTRIDTLSRRLADVARFDGSRRIRPCYSQLGG